MTTSTEWISVMDRMPDTGRTVLACGKSGNMNVLRYDGHSIRQGMFWWDSHAEWVSGITHWMPLPSPPDQPSGGPCG